MKTICFVVSMFIFSGCSGKLYTVINPALPQNGEERKIQGILVYPSVTVIEVYKTTALVDTNSGNHIGSAKKGDCTPDKITKFSTRADYNNPSIVLYEPGLFETNKFGIELEDGILSGVNTESNPTAALPNIASVLPFVRAPKTAQSFAGVRGKPLCNASPQFAGVYRAPDIRPFSEIND